MYLSNQNNLYYTFSFDSLFRLTYLLKVLHDSIGRLLTCILCCRYAITAADILCNRVLTVISYVVIY